MDEMYEKMQSLDYMMLKAARDNDIESLKEKMASSSIDINYADGGFSPLMYACLNGNIEMTKYLLEKGADVNYVFHGAYDESALRVAIETVHPEIALLLIDHGVSESVRDVAFFKAIEGNSEEVFDALIATGADINQLDAGGLSPIYKANAQMAKKLIELGAEVNQADEEGETPLHFVADQEKLNVLLLAGANVNVCNDFGDSPLSAVLRSCKGKKQMDVMGMTTRLLDAGAEISEKDIKLANRAGVKDVEEFLRNHFEQKKFGPTVAPTEASKKQLKL